MFSFHFSVLYTYPCAPRTDLLHISFTFYFILFLNFTVLYWFCQTLKWIRHRYRWHSGYLYKLHIHRKPDLMSRIWQWDSGNRAERWRKVKELKQLTEYVKDYVNGPQSIRDSTGRELENTSIVAKARCWCTYFVDSFAMDFVLLW